MAPTDPSAPSASANDFTWYHSEGDDNPIGSEAPIKKGRIQRSGRGEKMAEALRFEKADEHGNPIRRLNAPIAGAPRKPRQVKKPRVDRDTIVVISTDDEDLNYKTTEAEESEGSTDEEWPNQCGYESIDDAPSNAEVR
jgi:hypothetical protein